MNQRFTLVFTLLLLSQLAPAQTPTDSKVVISQIYGGAGCGTAGCSAYKNDYIEIYNRSTVPVSLNGYSIQYAAAAGTAWQPVPLTNVVLQPGQYYLIAQGAGSNGVSDIPTPDASGTIAMSSTSAKVALVNTTIALSGACPTSATILDLVGYGSSATCSEGAPTPAPSTTNAVFRGGGGTVDANNNASDFTAAPAAPRNTSSPTGATIPLPIILSQFIATKVGGKVDLSWKTGAGSEAAASFTVERSQDGSLYSEIGKVTPSFFGQTEFGFQDASALLHTSFYRLKLMGNSGTFRYSSTVMVRSEEIGGLKLFPNPAQNHLQISFAASGRTDIELLETTGRRVKTIRVSQTGATTLTLDISQLSPGTYFVQAGAERYPFVKL